MRMDWHKLELTLVLVWALAVMVVFNDLLNGPFKRLPTAPLNFNLLNSRLPENFTRLDQAEIGTVAAKIPLHRLSKMSDDAIS